MGWDARIQAAASVEQVTTTEESALTLTVDTVDDSHWVVTSDDGMVC